MRTLHQISEHKTRHTKIFGNLVTDSKVKRVTLNERENDVTRSPMAKEEAPDNYVLFLDGQRVLFARFRSTIVQTQGPRSTYLLTAY